MLWIPLILLLGAFCVSDLLRQFGRPATGLTSLILGLAFALGAVGLTVQLAAEIDLATAERALDWARSGIASQPALVTTLLAGSGVLLSMGGAARLVDRVALSDPDGPMPSTFAPGLAVALGVLLLVGAYIRL